MPTKTQAIVISEKGGKYQIKDVILDDPEEDEVSWEELGSYG